MREDARALIAALTQPIQYISLSYLNCWSFENFLIEFSLSIVSFCFCCCMQINGRYFRFKLNQFESCDPFGLRLPYFQARTKRTHTHTHTSRRCIRVAHKQRSNCRRLKKISALNGNEWKAIQRLPNNNCHLFIYIRYTYYYS